MTEPVIPVTQNDVLAILGAKEVEIQMLRGKVAQLEAQVVKLTPKPEEPQKAD
jgi:hypothetical protein